jgi:hypothetical protein
MPESKGYETRDVSVRGVGLFGLGLTIAICVFFILGVGLYRFFKAAHPSLGSPSRIELRPEMIAPAPRLESNPSVDLETFRAAEEAKLNSYGWIDKDTGIVRIPIERAMDLIAQRGLPTRGPRTKNSSGITPEQLQQQKAAATAPRAR